MGKLVQYSCDKCNTVQTEDDDLGGLEQVAVFCHNNDLDEPKILDFEFVCLACRTEISELVRHWAGWL